MKSARTGKIGDGKIFISSVEQAVRIGTEKRRTSPLTTGQRNENRTIKNNKNKKVWQKLPTTSSSGNKALLTGIDGLTINANAHRPRRLPMADLRGAVALRRADGGLRHVVRPSGGTGVVFRDSGELLQLSKLYPGAGSCEICMPSRVYVQNQVL